MVKIIQLSFAKTTREMLLVALGLLVLQFTGRSTAEAENNVTTSSSDGTTVDGNTASVSVTSSASVTSSTTYQNELVSSLNQTMSLIETNQTISTNTTIAAATTSQDDFTSNATEENVVVSNTTENANASSTAAATTSSTSTTMAGTISVVASATSTVSMTTTSSNDNVTATASNDSMTATASTVSVTTTASTVSMTVTSSNDNVTTTASNDSMTATASDDSMTATASNGTSLSPATIVTASAAITITNVSAYTDNPIVTSILVANVTPMVIPIVTPTVAPMTTSLVTPSLASILSLTITRGDNATNGSPITAYLAGTANITSILSPAGTGDAASATSFAFVNATTSSSAVKSSSIPTVFVNSSAALNVSVMRVQETLLLSLNGSITISNIVYNDTMSNLSSATANSLEKQICDGVNASSRSTGHKLVSCSLLGIRAGSVVTDILTTFELASDPSGRPQSELRYNATLDLIEAILNDFNASSSLQLKEIVLNQVDTATGNITLSTSAYSTTSDASFLTEYSTTEDSSTDSGTVSESAPDVLERLMLSLIGKITIANPGYDALSDFNSTDTTRLEKQICDGVNASTRPTWHKLDSCIVFGISGDSVEADIVMTFELAPDYTGSLVSELRKNATRDITRAIQDGFDDVSELELKEIVLEQVNVIEDQSQVYEGEISCYQSSMDENCETVAQCYVRHHNDTLTFGCVDVSNYSCDDEIYSESERFECCATDLCNDMMFQVAVENGFSPTVQASITNNSLEIRLPPICRANPVRCQISVDCPVELNCTESVANSTYFSGMISANNNTQSATSYSINIAFAIIGGEDSSKSITYNTAPDAVKWIEFSRSSNFSSVQARWAASPRASAYTVKFETGSSTSQLMNITNTVYIRHNLPSAVSCRAFVAVIFQDKMSTFVASSYLDLPPTINQPQITANINQLSASWTTQLAVEYCELYINEVYVDDSLMRRSNLQGRSRMFIVDAMCTPGSQFPVTIKCCYRRNRELACQLANYTEITTSQPEGIQNLKTVIRTSDMIKLEWTNPSTPFDFIRVTAAGTDLDLNITNKSNFVYISGLKPETKYVFKVMTVSRFEVESRVASIQGSTNEEAPVALYVIGIISAIIIVIAIGFVIKIFFFDANRKIHVDDAVDFNYNKPRKSTLDPPAP